MPLLGGDSAADGWPLPLQFQAYNSAGVQLQVTWSDDLPQFSNWQKYRRSSIQFC